MQISSLANFKYSPTFKSTTRTTYMSDSLGEFVLSNFNKSIEKNIAFVNRPDIRMVVSNSTTFFRDDFPWEDIGRIFEHKFPEGKVNISDFGCSDGSEAYSLAIALIEQLGLEEAQRFFPIKASDVDSEIIKMANSGTIFATDEDIRLIKKAIKDGNIEKYFEVEDIGDKKHTLTPKKILKDNIVFEQKNISSGLDEVNKDENNIIMCRNFWKYLTRNNMSDASWKMLEKLSDNSMVLIGNFDLYHCEEPPFFMLAMGLDSMDCCSKQRNILLYDKDKVNFMVTKDKETWDKYIASRFGLYVPGYIN